MPHHRRLQRPMRRDAAALARAPAHRVEQATPGVRRGEAMEHPRRLPLAAIGRISPGGRAGGIVEHAQMQRSGAATLARARDRPAKFLRAKVGPQPEPVTEPGDGGDIDVVVGLLVAPVRPPRRRGEPAQRGAGGEIERARERTQRAKAGKRGPVFELLQRERRRFEHAHPFEAVGRDGEIVERLTHRERGAVGAVGDGEIEIELAALAQNLHGGERMARIGRGHQGASDGDFQRAPVQHKARAGGPDEGADAALAVERHQRVGIADAIGVFEIERLHVIRDLGAGARRAAHFAKALQEQVGDSFQIVLDERAHARI